MTQNRATIIGSTAVLLWSLLAVLTVASAPFPPLQLTAICFGIAGSLGLVWAAATNQLRSLRNVPWAVYAFGTAGLFGYHFLYFSALRIAPPGQAGLIAYLWPLLIVLFSGLLPGEQLRVGHIIGAALGFGGAALIILSNADSFGTGRLLGYALAFGGALTWSGYSIISRRLGAIPTSSVAVFCLLSAVLSAAAHVTFETTVWPKSTMTWTAVFALGIGPVGLAFFAWDIGVKQGNIQLLGVIAYAAPLLSTAILVAAGFATAHWSLLLATLLISGGAYLAARAG